MSTRRPKGMLWAAVAGVVGAGVYLAVCEAVALLVAPGANPVLDVAGSIIDVVPRPVKEFAISAFGTADKPVLVASVGVAAFIGAAVAGVLQLRRPPWGVAVLGLGAAAALAAVVTRPGAAMLTPLAPAAGTLAGCFVLAVLVARLRAWLGLPGRDETGEPAGSSGRGRAAVDRRAFFVLTAAAAVSAAAIGLGARLADGARTSVEAVRGALRLPTPPAVEVPAGAELGIRGLSLLYTPNDAFYRVDTALEVPVVDPAAWRLVVDGLVDEPLDLSFDEMIGKGLQEYSITLTCVSNEVGGDLVGTARWWGVPVRDILRMARPQDGADMVLSRSVDGFTASTPLEALTDDGIDAILAVAMNGEPLPLEHGFPVRMVVPGLYGYVSATKWLTRLTVTTFAEDEAYWTPRGYAARAPVKLSSRMDTPRPGSRVAAGRVALAGVAWAQTVGIERVEVSIDDGPWTAAELSAPVNADTWVQWTIPWDAEPGTHYVSVRAVDRNGQVQIEERSPIAPDGSTGWQRTLLTVV
ncbi:molybdopterin-dependent oxidoreductase [Microbacter sp. GSS18]|nr:molybdopterin-dependent oxidoreductase [Microbacter sp. GSS18]